MVTTVKGGLRDLSPLQIVATALRGRGKPAPTAIPADTDPRTAERLRQEQQAVEDLKRVNDDLKRQRKAAAADKVARLKEELDRLRMFAGIGDPKAVARQVARIARELSAAVREYRAGGGSPGPDATGPAPGGAEAAAKEAEQTPTPDAKAAEGKPLTPQQRAEKEREDFTASFQKASGERKAAAKFADDVRQVAAALRSLMAELKAKARREDKDGDETGRMLRSAAAELGDVDQMVGDLGQSFPAVNLSV